MVVLLLHPVHTSQPLLYGLSVIAFLTLPNVPWNKSITWYPQLSPSDKIRLYIRQ